MSAPSDTSDSERFRRYYNCWFIVVVDHGTGVDPDERLELRVRRHRHQHVHRRLQAQRIGKSEYIFR